MSPYGNFGQENEVTPSKDNIRVASKKIYCILISTMTNVTAHLAIPLLNELDQLERLQQSLEAQTYSSMHVWMIVNQPESWWGMPAQREKCEANRKTLEKLQAWNAPFPVTVIDRSSVGQGWPEGKGGVGWARKIVMDAAAASAASEDILIAMDADTVYPARYVASVMDRFVEKPKAVAAALPYEHPLTGNILLDQAMLRYELYLRHYFVELFRTGTIFNFTALGSAMASRVKAYRAIGGLTPKPGGEDFYFLQKLRKYGPLILWNEVEAIPGTRLSDRVGFGTGPALIKGVEGEWKSYPIYAPEVTSEIAEFIATFPALYEADVETVVSQFLKAQLKTDDLWSKLRKTMPTQAHFVRACHDRFDGLRLLQYHHAKISNEETDDERLKRFARQVMPELLPLIPQEEPLEQMSVEALGRLRAALKQVETRYRKSHDKTF